MDTTTHKLAPGTRVYENGWPTTVGTVVQESPAGDDWYFIKYGNSPNTLSIPRHKLTVVNPDAPHECNGQWLLPSPNVEQYVPCSICGA